MLNIKILVLAIGSSVMSFFMFVILYKGYVTGVANLRYGNTVDINDSPISYWLTMSMSLCLACLFLWAAFGLFKLLFE